MYAIEVKNLVKTYSGVRVLDSVSIEVYEGEIYGLLGPNGAGKSTLIEIILGLRPRDGGEIRVFEVDIDNSKFDKKILGYVPQDHLLYTNLTGIDNIRYFAGLYGISRREFINRISKLKRFLELNDDLLRKDVSKMSGGQRRRIALATSLISDPKIVIMDEPTTGLDPNVRRDFWKLILELNREGKTIILTTHYMEEADELCDRISIIDKGGILATGTPEELKANYGGRESLIVRMRSRFLDKAVEILAGYKPEIISEDSIRLLGLNEEDIPVIRDLLEGAGLWIDGLEIRRPSLDDVFIKLTGRRLESG